MDKAKEERDSAFSQLKEAYAAHLSKLKEEQVVEISRLKTQHEDALADERTEGYLQLIMGSLILQYNIIHTLIML